MEQPLDRQPSQPDGSYSVTISLLLVYRGSQLPPELLNLLQQLIGDEGAVGSIAEILERFRRQGGGHGFFDIGELRRRAKDPGDDRPTSGDTSARAEPL